MNLLAPLKKTSWNTLLKDEFQKPYFQKLLESLDQEQKNGFRVYPPEPLIFNAFIHTPYEKVKVVIMGQDPYHGPGQAHGLSFSVPKDVPIPPSLKNIYKELVSDIGVPFPRHGSLISWADQGVLLLNAALTVRENSPATRAHQLWGHFTDAVISLLAKSEQPIVFVLWGNHAQKKCEHLLVENANRDHLVLQSPHPSPLSARRGFFGCRHFSKINAFLKKHHCEPIDWTISA